MAVINLNNTSGCFQNYLCLDCLQNREFRALGRRLSLGIFFTSAPNNSNMQICVEKLLSNTLALSYSIKLAQKKHKVAKVRSTQT
jgi:hypothetical protein